MSEPLAKAPSDLHGKSRKHRDGLCPTCGLEGIGEGVDIGGLGSAAPFVSVRTEPI